MHFRVLTPIEPVRRLPPHPRQEAAYANRGQIVGSSFSFSVNLDCVKTYAYIQFNTGFVTYDAAGLYPTNPGA